MNTRVIVTLFLFANLQAIGQRASLGSWNILNLRFTMNKKWSVFAEGQLRSLHFYDQFHYYEYKGGLEYKAMTGLRLAMAAGSYQTYKEGGNFVLPKNNDEIRIWPQVTLNQNLGKVVLEQRYRMEMRFTSNGYRNRFRYRLGMQVPLAPKKENYIPWQFLATNEIFFTDREPYFERNRMQVGFTYKPAAKQTLLLGFVHQFDYKINDETGRDFLQIGYYLEFGR